MVGLSFGTDGKLYIDTRFFLSSTSFICVNSIVRFEIFLSNAKRSLNSITENLWRDMISFDKLTECIVDFFALVSIRLYFFIISLYNSRYPIAFSLKSRQQLYLFTSDSKLLLIIFNTEIDPFSFSCV